MTDILSRLREWQNTCPEGDPIIDALLSDIHAALPRIEALEAENAALRAQLNPRFDEYGAYGENNPPVGAPSTREPTTPTLRWVWNAVPLKGHIGGPFVAEKVLQQCVRDADGNMVWQDVGEHNPPVQEGTGE